MEQKLHIGITGWGDRCSVARTTSKYTYDDVAELLTVSHKAVQIQEGKNKTTNIDPFYLEAFSLIYDRSPYYFLGLKSPHSVCSTGTPNKLVAKCSNIIIGFLYDESDNDKLEHLETITQIAKFKTPKYRILMDFLSETRTFSNILNSCPLTQPSADDDRWRYKGIGQLLESDQRNSKEYYQRRIFWEACYVLKDLEKHNPARLLVLSKLALCDANDARVLRHIIFGAGFPKDPKSIQSYNVDSILIKGHNSTGKKVRGYTL